MRPDRRHRTSITCGPVIAGPQEAGEIDVLVSNAGEIFVAAVEATPPEGTRAAAGHQHDRCPAGGAGGPARDARPRRRTTAVHVQHRGRIAPPRQAAYAATKWAFEVLVEALAIEAGPLGIEAALLEPGPVSSDGARASQMITPEEVAAGIADAAEAPQLPLRIPIGRLAAEILAARQAAPDDRPFIPGASTAVRS
jgi:NAD(P)-dependent dehydrogenase (short-subunit alcohol dehydrogenase family)